jgi:outer membrane autotransporter protein
LFEKVPLLSSSKHMKSTPPKRMSIKRGQPGTDQLLPRWTHPAPSVLAIALAGALSSSGAFAATWTNTTGDNLWNSNGNWLPGGVPVLGDDAVIDLGGAGAAKVTQPGAVAAGLVVGDTASGQLSVLNGASLTTDTGVIGAATGSSGSMSVSGTNAVWTDKGLTTIGSSGTGQLLLLGGGQFNSASVVLGDQSGAKGTVIVNGGSQWTSTQDITVGSTGSGTLNVLAGGVEAQNLFVAGAPDSIGVAQINGATSLLILNQNAVVGAAGQGTLDINNGGAATVSGDVIVGQLAGSAGHLTASGLASKLTVNGDLTVGSAGKGTLDIQGQGTVHAVGAATVGSSGKSHSVANVTGGGALLTVDSSLLVGGSSGGGELNISNAAQVAVGGSISIGNGAPDAVGAVSVGGNGAKLGTGSLLTVGGDGIGTLVISPGGRVDSLSARVGDLTSGVGTVTLNGGIWFADGNLVVGNLGKASLNVTNGSKLDSTTSVIGAGPTSVGLATVDGPGSTWTNTGNLGIGLGGTGSLTIANQGVVSVGGLVSMTEGGGGGGVGTLNIGAAPGSPAVGAGILNAAALSFGDGTGTVNFNHTDVAYAFPTALIGPGTLNQLAGDTTLTADSPLFSGPTNVTGGRLAVDGSLAASTITVSNAGTLGGVGTVGTVIAQAGGTIAPGNGIGTLNVNGSITFNPGSTFQVEVDAAGNTDRVAVKGIAALNGKVQVLAGAGNFAPSTQYTILTAEGGRTGAFSGVSSNMAFLDPSLSYDPNAAYLTLTRNSQPFGGVGTTPNQTNTGGGVESTGAGGLYDRILTMDAASARNAFDRLSGEVYASVRSVLIEDSRFVREAAMDRLRPVGAAGFAGTTGASRDTRGVALWSRAIGTWGKFDSHHGDQNNLGTARINRDLGGLLVGADVDLGDIWRAGVIGGISHSTFNARERNSSGSSDNFHAGVYSGFRRDNWGMRTGVAYTRHKLDIGRSVFFPGFADTLRSNYDASTTQAFGELSYEVRRDRGVLEPFANLAHVNLSSGRFTERGGPAALTSQGGSTTVSYATLGLRGSTKLNLGNGANVTASAMLGWTHALGSVTPQSRMTLAGGTPFAISGVPLANNVAVVETALDLRLSPRSTLSVSYGGQFGSGVRDQGLKVNFSLRF